MPCVNSPGIIGGLNELIDGGGVEKYGSLACLCCGGFGDIEPPLNRSGNPDCGMSRAKVFCVINGGAIIGCCHMEFVAAAGLFDPSSMTSLIPLWLVVLIAD